MARTSTRPVREISSDEFYNGLGLAWLSVLIAGTLPLHSRHTYNATHRSRTVILFVVQICSVSIFERDLVTCKNCGTHFLHLDLPSEISVSRDITYGCVWISLLL